MSDRQPTDQQSHGETVEAECINVGAVCANCLVPFKDKAPGQRRVCELCWEAAGVVDGEINDGDEE